MYRIIYIFPKGSIFIKPLFIMKFEFLVNNFACFTNSR